jgi:hypothetical protein
LRGVEADLIEKVRAIIEKVHVAVRRVGHQMAAVRCAPALLGIPIAGVVVGEHLLRELEGRIDLSERRQESAFIELDGPLRVQVEDVVGALLAAHGVARLFQHAAERRHIQLHAVAGLLLIELHDFLEAAVPRRGIYQDGDRRLLADVQEGLGRCTGTGQGGRNGDGRQHDSAPMS